MTPEVAKDLTTIRNNTIAAQIAALETTIQVPLGYGTKFEPDTNHDGLTFTGGILGGPLIHRWRVCVQANCPAGVWSVLPTTLRDAGKIYQADLKPLGVTDFYGNEHIVTNGRAWVHEAHYPPGDFGNVTTWSADNTFTITDVIAFATTTLQGTDPKMYVQGVGYSYTLAPVAGKSGTTITTTGLSRPGTGFTPRYWLMRRPEFLSDEQVNGSYWVDHTNQVIYFVAEGGGPPNDVRVAVSQRGLESQLGATDTCTFLNFEVGCTRNEAVLSVNGSVKMTGGEVWGAAYDGIKMHRKTDAHTAFDCQVDGVRVHDVGEHGVWLAVGNRRTGDSEGDNWVKRCNVSKPGNRYRMRAGIALQAEDKLDFDTPSVYTDERLYGCKMTAEDNYVHDCWSAGILVNGTANDVRGNLLVDCCTMTEDIGLIYGGGGNPSFGGHVIEGNTGIDCYSRSGYDVTNPDVMYVYVDDGLGSCLIQNNVFQNYTYGYFSNGGGRNYLYGNTFIQGSATARAWLRLNGTIITDSNALAYETADTPPGTAPQSIADRIGEIDGWFDAAFAATRGTDNLGALSPSPTSWRLPTTTLVGNTLDNRNSDTVSGVAKAGNVVSGGEHDGEFGNETVGYFDIDAQVTVGASTGTVADPPETPPTGVPASR